MVGESSVKPFSSCAGGDIEVCAVAALGFDTNVYLSLALLVEKT